jgi:bifunctional non-homologous end joining protein LigD
MASHSGPSASAPTPGAIRGSPPADQAPQLCSLVRKPPVGPAWFTEVKFDGYRFLAWKTTEGVRLVTRNGHDCADRLPTVARSIANLPTARFVIDGELVR